jgi:hypothetical protein
VDLAAEALIQYVGQTSVEIHDPRQKALVHASATLLYVVNTYDDILDVYGPAGLIDDVERIKRAYDILPLADASGRVPKRTAQHSVSERLDCDRTVIRQTQNLEERGGLRTHTE